ncbi:MAG: hypothetical protein ABIT37_05825 [Luteolibacter sp.]
MDLQASILKLTFDPASAALVLLDYGWMLADGPLRFPQKNGTEVVPSPDSSYPLILDTLNSQFVIKYTVVDDAAGSRAASMTAVLNSLISVAALGVKPLKIEVDGVGGGHYWQAAQCKVSENEPWHQPHSRFARTVKSLTLTCAGLSYV